MRVSLTASKVAFMERYGGLPSFTLLVLLSNLIIFVDMFSDKNSTVISLVYSSILFTLWTPLVYISWNTNATKLLYLSMPRIDFVDAPLTEDEITRLESNYSEISTYLGPYPSESYRDWVSLSNLVDQSTIARLLPLCGRIYSSPLLQSVASSSQQRLALKSQSQEVETIKPMAEHSLPDLKIVPGTELRWTELPTMPLYPANSNAGDITRHSMDQSYTLEHVLNMLTNHVADFVSSETSCCHRRSKMADKLTASERELLAELQLTFVTLLLNNVYDSWTHWRHLISLLANCESAVRNHPNLYMCLISVLYHQLSCASKSTDSATANQSPSDQPTNQSAAELADLFFSRTVDHSREPAFLPVVVQRLVDNVVSACSGFAEDDDDDDDSVLIEKTVQDGLKHKIEGLVNSLEQRFGWGLRIRSCPTSNRSNGVELVDEIGIDEVDWDTEDAPVIVEV